MRSQPRLFHLLNQARQALLTRANAETVAQLDITVSQMVCLFQLVQQGASRPTELSAALALDPAAITRVVARLEEKGLVRRTEHAADGRSRLVDITAAGRERARRGLAVLAKANAALTQGFDDEEIRTVARFLEHAIALGRGTSS